MNPDGSSAKLILGDSQAWFPTWSPGGSKIAYVKSGALYSMNADGSGSTLIVSLPWLPPNESIEYPSWSNSNQILFDAQDTSNINQSWVINPDGTGLSQLTHFTIALNYGPIDANMSMDGKRIVYACNDLGGLCIMNSDGSGSQKIAQPPNNDYAFYPRWSIDGSKIAFANYGIFTINSDGSGLTELLSDSGSEGHTQPVWLSSQEIVYTDGSTKGEYLYVMNAYGSNQSQLSRQSPSQFKDCSRCPRFDN